MAISVNSVLLMPSSAPETMVRTTITVTECPAASARGVGIARWLWRALWRPTASPVVSVFGLAAGTLLSGALAVELVIAWPGLGRLMFEALAARDTPLAAGCGAAAAAFLAVWTTLGDLAAWWLDPRMRPEAGR